MQKLFQPPRAESLRAHVTRSIDVLYLKVEHRLGPMISGKRNVGEEMLNIPPKFTEE